ncbi:MAG: FmdE family protein [Fastidiosipilaceae bacterium]
MDSWERVVAFHGHPCCVLAAGYRAALLALDELGPLQEGEHLDAFVETADCSTDPVQVLLNCTTGNRHLVVRERGKHVFTVQKPGYAIRIVLKPGIIGRYGKEYTNLMEKVANGKGTSDELERFQSWSQPLIDYILRAPAEELFECKEIPYVAFDPGFAFDLFLCDVCGEEAPTKYSLIKDGKRVCLECADKE